MQVQQNLWDGTNWSNNPTGLKCTLDLEVESLQEQLKQAALVWGGYDPGTGTPTISATTEEYLGPGSIQSLDIDVTGIRRKNFGNKNKLIVAVKLGKRIYH